MFSININASNRIALFSDIHGNYQVLETILKDIKKGA